MKYHLQKTKQIGTLENFRISVAEKVNQVHKTWKEYQATPLYEDGQLPLKQVYVKDESKRFGLNAFKVLGSLYALDQAKDQGDTFCTATDGNHGRGLAWAARAYGKNCVVYLPKGSSLERLKNIQALGAEARILDLGYDDCVRYAKKMSEEKGWCLVQDTAFEGYEEIPLHIMQGYLTIGLECVDQMKFFPTHVFLQAGVGSFAASMAGFFTNYALEKGLKVPKFILVEPETADCFYRSAVSERITPVLGEMNSMMAGLCCGEPNPLAWEILKDRVCCCLSCEDETAALGMRNLYPTVISGESGAVSYGALTRIMKEDLYTDLRKELGLNRDSVVLCISTEGDTDRENYQRIINRGNI